MFDTLTSSMVPSKYVQVPVDAGQPLVLAAPAVYAGERRSRCADSGCGGRIVNVAEGDGAGTADFAPGNGEATANGQTIVCGGAGQSRGSRHGDGRRLDKRQRLLSCSKNRIRWVSEAAAHECSMLTFSSALCQLTIHETVTAHCPIEIRFSLWS